MSSDTGDFHRWLYTSYRSCVQYRSTSCLLRFCTRERIPVLGCLNCVSGCLPSAGKPMTKRKAYDLRHRLFHRVLAHERGQHESIGQLSSALSTSSLQDLSAVGSSHSLSEAVFDLSLALLRLVCSLHAVAPPSKIGI